MDYCEFNCKSNCLSNESKELLTAFLADCGFESFIEEQDDFKAYIQKEQYNANTLQKAISNAETLLGKIPYSVCEMPSQNWNSTWESTFEYAEISNDILVRIPTFKPTKQYKHEIIIDPKMSFGSGTHETTSQILQTMATLDFSGKTVVDCGCGTGILGIFAKKLGAKSIFAFDYDSCCVENTNTNIKLNECTDFHVELAKLDVLQEKTFDYVIANINRNILIENMQFLAQAVNQNGTAIMSGFYQEDVPAIENTAKSFGLKINEVKSKNNWTIITFTHK